MEDEGRVVPIDIAKRRNEARQREVSEGLACPDDDQAARDLCLHVLTEDLKRSLGVGLFPPPEGFKAWLLTPDQADELALQLVRNAAAARARLKQEQEEGQQL